MSDNKVWFITGAGRGMGFEFAKYILLLFKKQLKNKADFPFPNFDSIGFCYIRDN